VTVDLRNDRVVRINGSIKLNRREPARNVFDVIGTNYRGGLIDHRLYINGRYFQIPYRVYESLEDQNSCADFLAYYLLHSRLLLSIECRDGEDTVEQRTSLSRVAPAVMPVKRL